MGSGVGAIDFGEVSCLRDCVGDLFESLRCVCSSNATPAFDVRRLGDDDVMDEGVGEVFDVEGGDEDDALCCCCDWLVSVNAARRDFGVLNEGVCCLGVGGCCCCVGGGDVRVGVFANV